LDFVFSAALLRAQQYGIQPPAGEDDGPKLRATVAQLATAIQSKAFTPRSGVRIAVTEAEAAENAQQQEQDPSYADAGIFCFVCLWGFVSMNFFLHF
jgi:hypothetical protein